ncbi:MAG: InlB B-repeat-containing protein [Oscillospiraceae bacterium]|nr:InlB B-repeat-containing protein [Oscillospiraceae bacterium]
MTKRLLCALLALCLALSLGPFGAWGEADGTENAPLLGATVASGTCGENLTWTLDGAGTLTISGTGAMNDYASSDAAPWYSSQSEIKAVVVQNGATRIGDMVFSNCSSLTSVSIPDSVTGIGNGAFAYCSSLTSVSILYSVTSIGDYAFEGCSSLTSVSIPASVTSIGEAAFSWCSSLTSVSIPVGVTSIGGSAFFDCISLTNVSISDSVTGIGNGTFAYCSSLTNVSIPASVTSIGGHAFYECTALDKVYYSGSESQWSAIKIGSDNEPLTTANVIYNSEPAEPEDLDNDTCTVTFDANGGSGTMATQTVKAHTPFGLNANTFTRAGCSFAGWSTRADGRGLFYADKTEGAAVAGDTTLYAQWAKAAAGEPAAALTGLVKAVSLGDDHSAAIMADGSLWTWGWNQSGMLGDGTTSISRSSPVEIMDGVAAVSLGGYHSAAIKMDGSLWTWGDNSIGQLGSGKSDIYAHSIPEKVMDNVAAVSLGMNHSAAIKTDGSLWTWGSNNYGQLGDGTTSDCSSPVKVMDNVAAVSLGDFHSAAIKTDGSLWTWGWNGDGQLGDGTSTDRSKPVKIMDGAAAVSLGYDYSAAIKTDGSLWTWGFNGHGQLGDSTTTHRSRPEKVMDGVASVSLGSKHCAAVTTDGSLWTWGYNGNGQLGGGTSDENVHSSPVEIMGGVAAVSLGGHHSAAIQTDGSLWTWGFNWRGQLGDGTMDDSLVPIEITGGVADTDIYALLYSDGELVFQTGSAVASGRALMANTEAWNLKDLGILEHGFPDENETNIPGEWHSSVAWHKGETASKIKRVTFNVNLAPESTSHWFADCYNLETVQCIEKLDTSNVTDMGGMFYLCSALTALDVSGWDTSNVTDMSFMFFQCQKLAALDVSGWKTDRVTDMASMFNNCRSLTELDVSGFHTALVTDMSGMFGACVGVASLDVGGFDTSRVTNMDSMFGTCESLTALDVSGFDTALVTGSMSCMFNGCKKLTELDLSGWDTSKVAWMTYMFENCSALKTIYASEAFTTSGAAESRFLDYMFTGCTALVGGAGTTYAGTRTHGTYARIDGGEAAPGYFTAKNAPAVTNCTVTFDPNGGSGTMPAQTVTANTATTLSANAFTRDGYTFSGWNTAANGNGTSYADRASVTPDGNLTLYAQWAQNPDTYYTISLNANGGVGAMAEHTVKAGASTTLSANRFTRDGYTFTGWNTRADGTGEAYADRAAITPAADLTLYAQWTTDAAERFTVSFNAAGGTVGTAGITVANGSVYGALPVPERSGYRFDGWYTALSGGTPVTASTPVNLGADQTLYAHWTRITFNVSFYANGGTGAMPAQSVTADIPTALNANSFTRSGYTFIRWDTRIDGRGTSYAEGAEVTLGADLALYAQWQALSPNVIVTFDYNGGTGTLKTKTVKYDGKYGPLPTNPSRPGYSFMYWADPEDLPIDSESTVTIAGNHTLTAVWEANQYQITFKLNDGSGMDVGTVPATYGSGYGDVFPAEPERSGYLFAGWYTLAEGGRLVTAEAKMTTTSNHTLYAHWTTASFPVHYDANGGADAPPDQTKFLGAALTLSSRLPTLEGHEFLGWATDRAAKTALFKSGAAYRDDAPLTLYAVWRPLTYTVSYNANGGEGAPKNDSKTYGADLTLSGVKPTRKGYTFAGWAASRYGEAVYQPGGRYTANAGATLYAVWTRDNNSRLPASARDLGYYFGNTGRDFKYSGNYQVIPLSAYQLMFGQTERARQYWLLHELWNGNCFGMTATAGLLFENENEFLASSFSPGNNTAWDLKLTDSNGQFSLQTFIEAVQISQFSAMVQYDLVQNSFTDRRYPGPLNALVDAVGAFQRTGHDPAVVSVFGPDGSGHALLGYKVEASDTGAKLWVYDPNYPDDSSRYISLTRENGNYTGWEYKLSNKVAWGSTKGGESHISYVPYADIYAVWKNRGPGLGSGGAFVNVNMDVDIRDASGVSLASVSGGEVISNRSDIYKMDFLGVMLDEEGNIINAGSGSTSLWLPADRYTVERAEPLTGSAGLLGAPGDNLEISLTHTNQSAAVETGANTVVLDVDDGQRLNYVRFMPEDEGRGYNVTLSSSADDKGKEISLIGIVDGTKGTAISKMEGDIAVTGASDATAKLLVDKKETSLSAGMGAAGGVPSLVSISANGGGGAMSAIAVTGDTLELPACSFEAPFGKAFAGWKLDGDDTIYRPGEIVDVLDDATLLALWQDSNDKYTIKSVDVAEDAVTARVQSVQGEGGTLVVVSYDAGGRMLDSATRQLPDLAPGETADVPVDFPTAEAASIKAFVCDSQMRPLCGAYTLRVNQG